MIEVPVAVSEEVLTNQANPKPKVHWCKNAKKRHFRGTQKLTEMLAKTKGRIIWAKNMNKFILDRSD